MQTLEFRAMNTSVLLAAEGDGLALAGLQAARAFIEISEQRFSRFLADSELSMLNASAGQWFSVSEDLMELITLSVRYFKETDGLFDPSILPDLKRVGYDKSMEVIRAQAPMDGIASPRMVRPAFTKIGIDFTERRVHLPEGMELDFGGIAKGWIVEQATSLLKTYSPTCAINAGGDICFIGNPIDGSKWRVELEDPRVPGQTITVLSVDQSAVVTSSITKRTWNQNGQVRHHLIDPRTGEPAATDWLSATVIAPQITAAEVYAKALLIGGEHEASRLIARDPGLAYITVDPDGQISGSQIGKEYLIDYDYEYR
jgi:thiamine biosynthesis lipoprotein